MTPIRVTAIVYGLRYKGVLAPFNVLSGGKYGSCIFLQYFTEVVDVKTDERVVQRGRKWYISSFMTESEVVQTALMAVLAFEEHEARENFFYRDSRLFGPHIDNQALRSIAHIEETRNG